MINRFIESKKVGLHWDILQKEKWLILQRHCHSYGVFHFYNCAFNFALQCAVNAWCVQQMLVVCSVLNGMCVSFENMAVCTKWEHELHFVNSEEEIWWQRVILQGECQV